MSNDPAGVVAALIGESLAWDCSQAARLTRLTENLLRRHLPNAPAIRVLCVNFVDASGASAGLPLGEFIPVLRRDIFATPDKPPSVLPPVTPASLEKLRQGAEEAHRWLLQHPGEALAGYASDRLGAEAFRKSDVYLSVLAPLGVSDVWTLKCLVSDGQMFGLILPFLDAQPLLDDHEIGVLKAYAAATAESWFRVAELPKEAADSLARTRKLTPMQREVLGFALSGLPEDLIAVRLDRSKHTIHNHLRDLYRVFNVAGRSELQALSLQQEPPSDEA